MERKKGLQQEAVILNLGTFKVPAMPLKSEPEAYKTLGRIERTKKIEEVLRKKKEIWARFSASLVFLSYRRFSLA